MPGSSPPWFLRVDGGAGGADVRATAESLSRIRFDSLLDALDDSRRYAAVASPATREVADVIAHDLNLEQVREFLACALAARTAAWVKTSDVDVGAGCSFSDAGAAQGACGWAASPSNGSSVVNPTNDEVFLNAVGRDCTSVARLRVILDAGTKERPGGCASFGDVPESPWGACVRACDTVEKTLSILGLGSVLLEAHRASHKEKQTEDAMVADPQGGQTGRAESGNSFEATGFANSLVIVTAELAFDVGDFLWNTVIGTIQGCAAATAECIDDTSMLWPQMLRSNFDICSVDMLETTAAPFHCLQRKKQFSSKRRHPPKQ